VNTKFLPGHIAGLAGVAFIPAGINAMRYADEPATVQFQWETESLETVDGAQNSPAYL
jgi:hypothetical protein